MTVGIGADHGGAELKAVLHAHLVSRGFSVVDYGCTIGETVDYPTIARPVVKDVLSGTLDWAILLCGTGLGMSYVANRYPGIRAALCNDVFCAELAKKHNDANILCIGGRVLGGDKAIRVLNAFIDSRFEGGRHLTRINMIDQ